MAWGIEWAWNNQTDIPTGSREMTPDELDTYFTSLDRTKDFTNASKYEEAASKQEEGKDLLRMLRDGWFPINPTEIQEIEDKFWIPGAWDNEIREEFNGTLSRNDTGLELADNEMWLMVRDIISLPQNQWGSEIFTNMMADIKAVSLKRGGYYHIDSFFTEWDIVEWDVHFYPNTENSIYGSEPIRVGENSTLKDIGIQLLQWLMDGGTFVEGWENNWDLVTQIEENYGVNWDEVKEM